MKPNVTPSRNDRPPTRNGQAPTAAAAIQSLSAPAQPTAMATALSHSPLMSAQRQMIRTAFGLAASGGGMQNQLNPATSQPAQMFGSTQATVQRQERLGISSARILLGSTDYLVNGDGSVYLKEGSQTVAEQVNLYGTYTEDTQLEKNKQYLVQGNVAGKGSQMYMLWCTYVPENPSRQTGGPVELKLSK